MLTSRDIGATLRVTVTARNAAGQASASSPASAVVAGIAPASTQAPAITGTPVRGGTLSASTGAWSGSEPLSYGYQWQRCDGKGEGCTSITGANGTSYQPTAADVGHALRVAVTAENTAGAATTTSAATASVSGSGCSVTWTGSAGDGLWQTGGNWSTGNVPGSSDEACIPAGATASVGEGSHQVGSIKGEGSLAISGGSLELTDAARPSSLSSLSFESGTLDGPGSLTLSSAFTLRGNGVLAGTGSLVIGPEAKGLVEASSGCEPMHLDARTLVNEGALDYVWGTLEMSNGALLRNAGTLEYNTQSVCYEPQIRLGEESASPSAILNTGTFKRTAEGTGGVGVPFTNEGVVEAQGGRLEFSEGGVPEEAATGSWTTREGGSIALTGGTFLIGEEVDLSHVEVAGATVERGSGASGLHGSLNPHPYATGTITVSGVGRGSGFASASIEVAAQGSSEWQPLCGSLTPTLTGEYECAWNTTSGYPDGVYQLRAQLSDGTNTVTTATITVVVDNTPPAGTVSLPGTLEGELTVSGTATDAVSGVASWQLQIAPEGSSEWGAACPAQTNPASGSTYQCTVDSFNFANGAHQLRALITDKAGNTYTTTSAAATISNEPPANQTAPAISGTPSRGQTLTASAGTWRGNAPITYAYQWQRCNSSGEGCVNVTGATSPTYRLGLADVASTLRVIVSATNPLGSSSAASQASGAVEGPSCSQTWTGQAGDGSWGSAGNWSGGQVPGASDVACVPAGATVNVTGGSNLVGALEDEGSLVLSGGSLELADAAERSNLQSLTVRNATLTGPGPVFVSSSFTLGSDATLSGSGETVLESGALGEIYAASGCEAMHMSGRKLVNDGTLTFSWGTLMMTDGAQLENRGTFEDNSESSCCGPQIQLGEESTSAPSVMNAGVFEKTSGSGTSTVAVEFANQGEVQAQTGTLEFAAGGMPEETAYGSWVSVGLARIVFTAGTLWISEDVDLSGVHNNGATIDLVPGSGPPVSLAAPVITGETSVAQTLSGSTGRWKGARPLTYAYQWQRCDTTGASCADIPGASGPTYLLTPEDFKGTLRVKVTATNGEGSASSTSQATGTVGFPPVNTSPPTITGTAQDGQTLAASTGSWEGGSAITYSYQWQRCSEGGIVAAAAFRGFAAPLAGSSSRSCVNIPGATGSTYTLQDADVEDTVRVVVTAKDADGQASANSPESEVVIPATAPVNTGLPAITGTAQEGQTLQASTGSWQSPGKVSYAYQWQRCNAAGEACTDIEGATEPDYIPGIAGLGHTLKVTVTATNP
ncbi:MAG TPA: hypothetical protein VES97_13030, partial [Solirubrobacteraceae bacterium]|nr:hypothetical protein [Solirubrobacteraceae bacterium]